MGLAETRCADGDVIAIACVERIIEFLGSGHESLSRMLGIRNVVIEVLGIGQKADLITFRHSLGAMLGTRIVIGSEH